MILPGELRKAPESSASSGELRRKPRRATGVPATLRAIRRAWAILRDPAESTPRAQEASGG
eukprot:1405234-Alexandrium_andersonii.AAC.1